MWVLLLFSTASEIGAYTHWYRMAKQMAENGMFYEKTPSHTVSWIFLTLGVLMILLSLTDSPFFWWIAFLWAGVMIFIGITVRMVRNTLRKKGASRAFTRTVIIGVSVALSMLFMALLVFAILHDDLPRDSSAVGSYDIGGREINVYNDALPLCIEDLMDVPEVNWSREAGRNSTFLLTRTEYSQWPLTTEKGIPSLAYTGDTASLPNPL